MSINRPEIVGRSGKQIGREETSLIHYLLCMHEQQPAATKAGLQRLCTHYEGGRRLPLSGPLTRKSFRDLIIRLFWSRDTLVRRWSYKAARWVGLPEDGHALQRRMDSETDAENLTWAMATLISLSRVRDASAHRLDNSILVTPSMRLASRLFLDGNELLLLEPVRPISVNSDDYLLLKWATLLEGYGKAPENLFQGNHPTGRSLEELTLHPDDEVAEYSVWARWRARQYSLSNLGVEIDRLQKLPPNVRRWGYRLLTKDVNDAVAHLDLLQEIIAFEQDARAQEGLALGIRDLPRVTLEPLVLDWYEATQNENLLNPLLEHMAVNADLSGEYEEEVFRVFQQAVGDPPLRDRLIAASEGTKLRRRLTALQATDDLAIALSKYAQNEGGLFVNKSVNIYGDGNAVNHIGGDVYKSSVSAVARMPDALSKEKQFLESVLSFIESADIRPSEKSEVAKAVEAFADSPSQTSRGNLMDAIKALATSSSGVVAVVETANNLYDLGKSLFGI